MRREALAILPALALLAAGPLDVATSPAPGGGRRPGGRTGDRRSLLKEGADVNAAQGDGMTALHWSALANDVETAEMLLYAGANVKAATRLGGYTPLILASRSGHAAMVETLLNAGADPELATSTGSDPVDARGRVRKRFVRCGSSSRAEPRSTRRSRREARPP